MKVPEGMKKYSLTSVLLLEKNISLIETDSNAILEITFQGHSPNKVDLCMYYSGHKNEEVTIILNRVDDNITMGHNHIVN